MEKFIQENKFSFTAIKHEAFEFDKFFIFAHYIKDSEFAICFSTKTYLRNIMLQNLKDFSLLQLPHLS